MPRRKEVVRRSPPPDWKFESKLVSKFINGMMVQGKKSIAERIFYKAMEMIADSAQQEPLPVFEKAMKNVGPAVMVRSRRVGGSVYQVPSEVGQYQQRAIAIRWLLLAARGRSENTMIERLANELLAASKGEGAAVRRKEETYRMADANRAFAHYRW